MITHDDSARQGSDRHVHPGLGHNSGRECLPCGKRFFSQVGGGQFKWRGVERAWHCAACKAKRAERLAAVGSAA